jgi:hypothetical protein
MLASLGATPAAERYAQAVHTSLERAQEVDSSSDFYFFKG